MWRFPVFITTIALIFGLPPELIASEAKLWHDAILSSTQTIDLNTSDSKDGKRIVWSSDNQFFEYSDLNQISTDDTKKSLRLVLPTRKSAVRFWITQSGNSEIHTVAARQPDFQIEAQRLDPSLALGIKVNVIKPLSVPYVLLSSSKSPHDSISKDNSSHGQVVPLIMNGTGEILWWLDPDHLKLNWFEFAIFEKLNAAEFAIAFQREQSSFYHFNLSGKLIDRLHKHDIPNPISLHHDFLAMPLSDNFLFLGNSAREWAVCDLHRSWQVKAGGPCPVELRSSKLSVNGAVIYQYDPKSRKLNKMWDIFDEFSPTISPTWFHAWGPLDARESVQFRSEALQSRPFPVSDNEKAHIEWVHANTLDRDSRGNLIVLSRNLSSIYWIEPVKFRTIRSVGVGPGFAYQWASCEETPFGPHTVSELPDGRMLLFDNNTSRHCPFDQPYPPPEPSGNSRISIYRWDHKARVLRKDWSFEPKPSLFAFGRSSVRQLRNGNFLAYFSDIQPSGKDVIIEVNPGTSQEVGRIEIQRGGAFSGYRAEPIYSLYQP
jgi:hypothetical protein